MKSTTGATLCPFVEQFTQPEATAYIDEYDSNNQLQRVRHTVCHSQNEWARDDDGDGIREVRINSNEGGWTGLRNILRPFRGVHKKNLSRYSAIHELVVNRGQLQSRLARTCLGYRPFALVQFGVNISTVKTKFYRPIA